MAGLEEETTRGNPPGIDTSLSLPKESRTLTMQTLPPPNVPGYLDKPPSAIRHMARPYSTANLPSPLTSRTPSLQKTWADSYIHENNAAGNITLEFEPEAYARTSETSKAGAIKSGVDDEISQHKSRSLSRSVTDLFRPPRRKSTSPGHVPIKQDIDTDFMPTLTGDKAGLIKVADKSKGGLGSWFAGSSAPIQLPFGDKALPSQPSMSSPQSTSPERPTLPIELESGTPSPNPKTGMFGGFFSTPKPTTEEAKPLPTAIMNDELLALDINTALFPHGQPADPFSPASFKNLLQNAEGILLKLQSAYKGQALSLHEMQAEKSAMAEELEEAGTRTQMLKLQLEDMASKAQESDLAVAELATELTKAKKAIEEEKAARERSITLVKDNARKTRQSQISEGGEEDLGIKYAGAPGAGRDWKKWRGSADMSTEGESDAESCGAPSVFSRSRSPTFTLNSVSTRDSTPEIHQASFARMVPNLNPPSQRPKQTVQQKSTFQKIMQGISTSTTSPTEEKDPYGGIGLGEAGCSNCRGKDASVAWDTVGLLRSENKVLKEQVTTMEDGVEGALALCAGYGL